MSQEENNAVRTSDSSRSNSLSENDQIGGMGHDTSDPNKVSPETQPPETVSNLSSDSENGFVALTKKDLEINDATDPADTVKQLGN